jgi:glutathione S-transferase
MDTTLHQFAASPFCDKVRRILRFKGIEFATREWPLAEAGEIEKKNPSGKLPILEIDGRTIADSTDIALELESLHPSPSLLPENPRDRALVLALEDWADESLYFYEMTTRFGADDFARNLPKLVPDPALRDSMTEPLQEMIRGTTTAQGCGRRPDEQLESDLERLCGAVEELQRETGFVVGDAPTLADLAIACQLECIGDSSLGARVLERHPALREYLQRIDDLTHADRI